MIDREEISKRKTIIEHENYYNITMKEIKNNAEEVKKARIRKNIYKKFFEEYCVLLKYSKLKYGLCSNVEFEWVDIQGDTLNYDGRIYINEKLTEKVEITCPYLTKKDNDRAKEINKYGYVFEVGNVKNELKNLKDEIIQTINIKNEKRTYDKSITLLVYLEDYLHFWDSMDMCNKCLNGIKGEMKNKNYIFKNVYFLANINNKCFLEQIK